MRGVLRPPRGTHQPPALWQVVCESRFGASPRLAGELWDSYVETYPHTSRTTRFELDRLSTQCPDWAVEQRVRRLAEVVTPQDLLTAAQRLSPEGCPRRRDVRAFEETVLRHVNEAGDWR